jgi:CHAT domain-containing protein
LLPIFAPQPVKTRLVLLLACDSAAGDQQNNVENYTGLVRSFFLAGAATVMAAHWEVNEQMTDRFAIQILTELNTDKNVSIGHAHQLAIKWMLKRGVCLRIPSPGRASLWLETETPGSVPGRQTRRVVGMSWSTDQLAA